MTGSGDAGRVVARLAERFAGLHGAEPTTVCAAPGRVNLIGEHTDYNAGLCLPVALHHASYVAGRRRTDRLLTVASRQVDGSFAAALDDVGPGRVDGWAAYVAGVAWALGEAGLDLPGMDLLVDSQVPVGAGLSSSAALECSAALAMCAVAGVEVDDDLRGRLLAACMRAEREVAGAPTGGMDQTVALHAREGHALLLDFRDGSVEHVPWAPAGVEALVVDTRTRHALADGEYGVRRGQCEEAARRLGVADLRAVDDPARVAALDDHVLRRRARHVVTENARVRDAVAAIRRDDLPALGRLLDGSHASLRDDFEVSCAELDVAVDAARGAGALGARMTGGGFGGSALALVPADEVAGVERAVTAAFAARGWPLPGFLRGVGGAGGRQVLPG